MHTRACARTNTHTDTHKHADIQRHAYTDTLIYIIFVFIPFLVGREHNLLWLINMNVVECIKSYIKDVYLRILKSANNEIKLKICIKKCSK